jgi:hypothetical protein
MFCHNFSRSVNLNVSHTDIGRLHPGRMQAAANARFARIE